MAACPNCAHPLDASAACSACNQEQPPASDALLTPGPAAKKDRRRTLLALVPFLLLIASASLGLDLEGPVLWLICLVVAAMTFWYARTEPPRARWGPKLERSARRRDRAWMFFAITVCNVGVAGTIYGGLTLLLGPNDELWLSALGGRITAYFLLSTIICGAGCAVGLASVVWRLDVAARRRGRSPSRWLHRSALAMFLSSAIICLVLVCMLLRPPGLLMIFEVLPIGVLFDDPQMIGLTLAGLSLIGGLVILGMLPAALRSPRQQPSAA